METKDTKMAYESPEIKVVQFKVEKGFAATLTLLPTSLGEDYAGDALEEIEENTWFY